MKTIRDTVLVTTAMAVSALAFAEQAVEFVTIGERQWAQVDQFNAVSGEEIARVCPAGNCDAGTGQPLAGYDMTGWTWASESDVAALFSAHSPFAGVDEELAEANSTWGAAFFDTLGFRPTAESASGRALMGRTSSSPDIYRNVTGALSDFTDPAIGDAMTLQYWTPHHYTYANIGAFFYKDK